MTPSAYPPYWVVVARRKQKRDRVAAVPSIDICHCEERSDEAIQFLYRGSGLLRFARNDEVKRA
jgi:hypothetical protein